MDVITKILKTQRFTLEEELDLKRSKHLFVQWLVSGNRAMPSDAKPFANSYPEEAKALFDRFRERSRRRPKGKKHLFAN